MTQAQVQEHLDNYYSWFVHSKLPFYNLDGIRFVIAKLDASLRSELSQERLHHIDRNIELSWQHARELEEMARR